MKQKQIVRKKKKARQDTAQQRVKSKTSDKKLYHSHFQEQGIIGNHGALRNYSNNDINTKQSINLSNYEYIQDTDKVKDIVTQIPELQMQRQQGEKYSSPCWGQTVSVKDDNKAQMQWSNNAELSGTTDYKSIWSKSAKARSHSTGASSWSTAATSHAISQPQPVSWGTLENLDEWEQRIAGVKTSGPPVSTNLLTIQTHAGMNQAVGWTYFPTGYKAPNFNFKFTSKKVKGGKTEWYSNPTQATAAFEGSANSYYAKAGQHKTQLKETIKGSKVPADVYWNFSAAMSTRDKKAEQEHCNDHEYAYKISLKEAQDVLTNHVVGKAFGPKPTQVAVKGMVLNTIKNKLTHSKLGNDKTKWASKYNMLFRKTGDRDSKHWHSFGLGGRRVKGSKVIYDITKGTTNINTVKSSKVIKY